MISPPPLFRTAFPLFYSTRHYKGGRSSNYDCFYLWILRNHELLWILLTMLACFFCNCGRYKGSLNIWIYNLLQRKLTCNYLSTTYVKKPIILEQRLIGYTVRREKWLNKIGWGHFRCFTLKMILSEYKLWTIRPSSSKIDSNGYRNRLP